MGEENQNFTDASELLEGCEEIPGLVEFHRIYGTIHVYLMLIWCPIGIISNILNIIVLNQKRMRTSTNLLLTCLAVSDAVLMSLYVIFISYFVIGSKIRSCPHPMAVYLLIYVNLQDMLHIFSCGIIITVAVFRLLYARCILKCQQLCSMKRAKIAVIMVLLTSCLLTIPCMISHQVESASSDLGPGDYELRVVQDRNLTQMYTINYVDNIMLRTLVYWSTAIFVKLVPCVSMITLSSLLVMSIHQRAKLHRQSLEKKKKKGILNGKEGLTTENTNLAAIKIENECSGVVGSAIERAKHIDRAKERSHSRATHTMLAIMFIYIVTYLPQVRDFIKLNFQQHAK